MKVVIDYDPADDQVTVELSNEELLDFVEALVKRIEKAKVDLHALGIIRPQGVAR